jgi:hypothetical protein
MEHHVGNALRCGRHKHLHFTLGGCAALTRRSPRRFQVRAITLTARRRASEGHCRDGLAHGDRAGDRVERQSRHQRRIYIRAKDIVHVTHAPTLFLAAARPVRELPRGGPRSSVKQKCITYSRCL